MTKDKIKTNCPVFSVIREPEVTYGISLLSFVIWETTADLIYIQVAKYSLSSSLWFCIPSVDLPNVVDWSLIFKFADNPVT